MKIQIRLNDKSQHICIQAIEGYMFPLYTSINLRKFIPYFKEFRDYFFKADRELPF